MITLRIALVAVHTALTAPQSATLKGHQRDVTCVAIQGAHGPRAAHPGGGVHTDGKKLVSACMDMTLRVWEIE